MAITFAKETLRAVQNAFPIHETLPSTYADYGSVTSLPPPSCRAYMEELPNVDSIPSCNVCLGGLATVVHAHNMESTLLDWRRWLG